MPPPEKASPTIISSDHPGASRNRSPPRQTGVDVGDRLVDRQIGDVAAAGQHQNAAAAVSRTRR